MSTASPGSQLVLHTGRELPIVGTIALAAPLAGINHRARNRLAETKVVDRAAFAVDERVEQVAIGDVVTDRRRSTIG